MTTIKNIGRFLDQPRLVTNFAQKVPPLLSCAAAGIVLNDTFNTPLEDRQKRFIQNGLTMFGAVGSSLLAPKITSKLFKSAPKMVSLKEIEKLNTKHVNEFLSKNHIDTNTKDVLHKAKTGILSLNEIKSLSENLNTNEGKKLLQKLIPEPDNITSKEIFSEIGRLSVFGLIPVVGGILGGICGDRIVSDNYKEKIPNKIKEGTYQYLANIFLCNIGAGAALGIMEKSNVKSKSARALGMVAGIIATGVIGGSAIANLISKKFINKLFRHNSNTPEKTREPEALDICLHSDDIATVAVMSGLRWIEPTLPTLYSISGYRAGMGYRGKEHKKHKAKHL